MKVPLPFAEGVYASGQPSRDDLVAFAAAGVRTVINLRGPDETVGFDEPTTAQGLGLRYVAIPVTGTHDVTSETIMRFARELDQARRDGGILVHCASANRVGALIALEQGLVRGASRDEALAMGRAAGMASWGPWVEERLNRGMARD